MSDKIYDGEELFKAWVGWGRAATYKMLNEYTETKYGRSSQMGSYYAMWKWAWLNPEKSFPLWNTYRQHIGEKELTWEEYLAFVLEKAVQNGNVSGGESNITRFCVKYGLRKPAIVNVNEIVQVVDKDHSLFSRLFVVYKVKKRKNRKTGEFENMVSMYSILPGDQVENHVVKAESVASTNGRIFF